MKSFVSLLLVLVLVLLSAVPAFAGGARAVASVRGGGFAAPMTFAAPSCGVQSFAAPVQSYASVQSFAAPIQMQTFAAPVVAAPVQSYAAVQTQAFAAPVVAAPLAVPAYGVSGFGVAPGFGASASAVGGFGGASASASASGAAAGGRRGIFPIFRRRGTVARSVVRTP